MTYKENLSLDQKQNSITEGTKRNFNAVNNPNKAIQVNHQSQPE